MRTEAQKIVAHLKKDAVMYKLAISLIGEKKSWETMANDLGNENVELRKKLSKAESDLRKGREMYKELKQENKELKEWIEQS